LSKQVACAPLLAANGAAQTPPSRLAAVIASGQEDASAAYLETLYAAEA